MDILFGLDLGRTRHHRPIEAQRSASIRCIPYGATRLRSTPASIDEGDDADLPVRHSVPGESRDNLPLLVSRFFKKEESPFTRDQPQAIRPIIEHGRAWQMREGQGVSPGDVRMPEMVER